MRSRLAVPLAPSIGDLLDSPDAEVIRLKRVDAEVTESVTNYGISRFDKRKFTLKRKMKDRVKRQGFKFRKVRPVNLQRDIMVNDIPRAASIPLNPIEKASVYTVPSEEQPGKLIRNRRHTDPRSSVIQKIGSNPMDSTTASSATSSEPEETTTEESSGGGDCVVPVSQVCEMFEGVSDHLGGVKDIADTVGGIFGMGGSGGSKGGITDILKGAARMIPNPFASKS